MTLMREYSYRSTFYDDIESFTKASKDLHQKEPGAKNPLHKLIRARSWKLVLPLIRSDPAQILHTNRVGWTSLILSIYHNAPADVIAEMLALVSEADRKELLKTPVPNGSRLCLHFVARFSDNLEVYKLITEPYPKALIVASEDGVRPIDRATYYRKEADILNYLEMATEKELHRLRNQKMQQTVLECCQHLTMVGYKDERILNETSDIMFILDIYSYLRDREMDDIFCEITSYVGNPFSSNSNRTKP